MSKKGVGLDIKTIVSVLLLALIAYLLYLGWSKISGGIFG